MGLRKLNVACLATSAAPYLLMCLIAIAAIGGEPASPLLYRSWLSMECVGDTQLRNQLAADILTTCMESQDQATCRLIAGRTRALDNARQLELAACVAVNEWRGGNIDNAIALLFGASKMQNTAGARVPVCLAWAMIDEVDTALVALHATLEQTQYRREWKSLLLHLAVNGTDAELEDLVRASWPGTVEDRSACIAASIWKLRAAQRDLVARRVFKFIESRAAKLDCIDAVLAGSLSTGQFGTIANWIEILRKLESTPRFSVCFSMVKETALGLSVQRTAFEWMSDNFNATQELELKGLKLSQMAVATQQVNSRSNAERVCSEVASRLPPSAFPWLLATAEVECPQLLVLLFTHYKLALTKLPDAEANALLDRASFAVYLRLYRHHKEGYWSWWVWSNGDYKWLCDTLSNLRTGLSKKETFDALERVVRCNSFLVAEGLSEIVVQLLDKGSPDHAFRVCNVIAHFLDRPHPISLGMDLRSEVDGTDFGIWGPHFSGADVERDLGRVLQQLICRFSSNVEVTVLEQFLERFQDPYIKGRMLLGMAERQNKRN